MIEPSKSHEFLKECLKLKPHEVIKILEDHRNLSNQSIKRKDESILISIKIPESLLLEFKKSCSLKGLKYQTQIKEIMRNWLKNS